MKLFAVATVIATILSTGISGASAADAAPISVPHSEVISSAVDSQRSVPVSALADRRVQTFALPYAGGGLVIFDPLAGTLWRDHLSGQALTVSTGIKLAQNRDYPAQAVGSDKVVWF